MYLNFPILPNIISAVIRNCNDYRTFIKYKINKVNSRQRATKLASKHVGDNTKTVLAAGEADAKATFKDALKGSGLNFVDAGELSRARELEAIGFLQITLAAREKIAWTAGFAVVK